ncbi:MAG TPA: enolase C-terminal domain-like protein [Devosiaceae bacterium]|jgi:L-alanine-DL-glutamate epimerase-like enolase superfamily enzyme
MKITAIEFTRYVGRRSGASVASFRHTDRAMPSDIYSFREKRPALRALKGDAHGQEMAEELYLTIRTDEGVEGFYGPVDLSAAFTIKNFLEPMLIGEDPLAGALLWDKMYRSNRHSRTGLFMMGIGTIDNALWDLRGKYYNTPVYRLLGGSQDPVIEAYVSTIGYAQDAGAIREQALAFRQQGYRRQKWFMGRGPADGSEGLRHNVDLVRVLRETLGDDAELMFDASMAWDFNYTMMWADRVRDYRPRWIEEPFNPDKAEAWAALAQKCGIPVAGGEHLYTRWETKRFLETGAVSILQPDPEWCGGVTALVQMCAMGELYDATVIPHGHGLRAALHVVASQSPGTCPLGEFVERTMRRRYFFEKEPPLPENGEFHLSSRPGFGIIIDEAVVTEQSAWAA